VVLLGNLVDAAAIVRLPDKGLAHTFHRRSSPRPFADFLLVVSNVHASIWICYYCACVPFWIQRFVWDISCLSNINKKGYNTKRTVIRFASPSKLSRILKKLQCACRNINAPKEKSGLSNMYIIFNQLYECVAIVLTNFQDFSELPA